MIHEDGLARRRAAVEADDPRGRPAPGSKRAGTNLGIAYEAREGRQLVVRLRERGTRRLAESRLAPGGDVFLERGERGEDADALRLVQAVEDRALGRVILRVLGGRR